MVQKWTEVVLLRSTSRLVRVLLWSTCKVRQAKWTEAVGPLTVHGNGTYVVPACDKRRVCAQAHRRAAGSLLLLLVVALAHLCCELLQLGHHLARLPRTNRVFLAVRVRAAARGRAKRTRSGPEADRNGTLRSRTSYARCEGRDVNGLYKIV